MVLTRRVRAGVAAAFISAALAGADVALAHDEHDPRHRAMESMGEHMKALRRAAEGNVGPGPRAMSHAKALQEHARELPSLFSESSRGRAGSREKPEIWSDPSGFAAAAAGFQRAIDDVVSAASAGDGARLAAALKQAGGECGACHDRYREPKK